MLSSWDIGHTQRHSLFITEHVNRKDEGENFRIEHRSLKQINSPPYKSTIPAFIISAEGWGHFHQGWH